MDTDIASAKGATISARKAHIWPTRVRFVLALSLSIGVGALMLAFLAALAQNVSAETVPKGRGPNAPASPDCNDSWNLVSSPNPGTGESFLLGVAVASPDNVWAVGYYTD